MPVSEQFVEETVDLSRRYNLEMLWVVDDIPRRSRSLRRAIGGGPCSGGCGISMEHPGNNNLTRDSRSRT